jgi:hypothetical protein
MALAVEGEATPRTTPMAIATSTRNVRFLKIFTSGKKGRKSAAG